jgi:hypothetical protein
LRHEAGVNMINVEIAADAQLGDLEFVMPEDLC